MQSSMNIGRGVQLSIEQSVIDVTSSEPTIDPRWRFTDRNGHEHHYDHGYPTLDYIVDRSHWCDGSEGWAPHDPHEAVDEDHYECKLCRERIEPGMRPAYYPQSIPGERTATLKGYIGEGHTVTMVLLDDEVDAITTDPENAQQTALRLLSNAPRERIIVDEWLSS